MEPNGWHDFTRWVVDLWHGWKARASAFTFLLALATALTPQFRNSAIQAYIQPFFIIVVPFCFAWAAFSLYRQQLRRIEELEQRPVSRLGMIQVEKLLGEIRYNRDEMQQQPMAYTWRDEAWRFVGEGLLLLNDNLRDKIDRFYREVRSARDGSQLYRQNATRISLVLPHKETALKLTSEILPELEALVATNRTVS